VTELVRIFTDGSAMGIPVGVVGPPSFDRDQLNALYAEEDRIPVAQKWSSQQP
jgi:hypothetical protein